MVLRLDSVADVAGAASSRALENAGLVISGEDFVNSGVIEGARLAWLGDVFWIPSGWPLANVFSIGDVLIALGVVVAIVFAMRGRTRPLLPIVRPLPRGNSPE